MKKYIKYFLFITMISGFSGCDEYLDVNTPSDAVPVEDLDMKDILGPTLFNTVYAYYYAELSLCNYTQYYAGYGTAPVVESFNSSTWSNIYTKVLPNIENLKEKAIAQDAPHFLAVAKIITAMNLSFAVDNWDNVPYTQAGKPFEFPAPEFDDGEVVYNDMIVLLDEAISALSGASNPKFNLSSGDFIYKGDVAKWMRLAYTFKARMQLHMMKNGGVTASEVLSSINNGFTSNSDNFKLTYPEGELNPYYATNVQARSTSNYFRAPNDQLVSMLNGTTYPFESGTVEVDPRLPAMFVKEIGVNDPAPDTDPWRGFMNGGTGQSSDGEAGNTYYKDGGYYTKASAPLEVLTYAEAMFIKAEAAFLANGGTTSSAGTTSVAYNAYLAGIEGSMDQIGVDGTDYLADTAVAVGEGGLMLNHIMKEKYIANIHNTETWNDFRRYNFSADVFKGLALRLEEDNSDNEFAGEWIRRISYPTSELDANFDIVKANEKTPITPVWWAE
ncbi:SusD/RagB family nutrient-binding outer membrane lipoprotein [Algibacter miyuki]|uniref:SusD/RagB family nutrient-binding outer membrane lipoprotein n=1 Tax=Algibacter miyuki TaxID=1306933 RepID=A0ABV5GVL2_9FLAO|nr:SusD/RagB family nutrient-binding outer membrane lipoprotein [Algibacter miyuki]MDN3664999.1 SusD/RagB family nutrient-binding outer membrane lipoprotein [Algibacter miyuki]